MSGASHGGAPVVDTAQRFWSLLDVYWPIGVGVFALVCGALLFAGLRWRSDADEYPQGRSEWPALEYGYALAVAAVCGLLVWLTYSVMNDERETVATAYGGRPGVPAGALSIDVRAAQWSWRFTYPGGATVVGDNRRLPTLVVPAGRPVHFAITSVDVIHSFWIADRKLKVDAFPRRTTEVNLIWPRAGYWPLGGRCNQYCGLYHTDMNFNVRALAPAQFSGWLERLRAQAPGAAS